MRQEHESGTPRNQERPELSPRLRAVTRLRITALGGFGPSQARPQQAPLDGAALMVVMASVAAWAALDPQLTPDGATLVALVKDSHRQALYWATLVTLVAPVAARPQRRAAAWQ